MDSVAVRSVPDHICHSRDEPGKMRDKPMEFSFDLRHPAVVTDGTGRVQTSPQSSLELCHRVACMDFCFPSECTRVYRQASREMTQNWCVANGV